MVPSAKIPSGCMWNEALISPLKRYDIEWPNPQPGQYLKPKLLKGQSVK